MNPRELARSWGFVVGLLLLALARIWLVHEHDYYRSANFYDELCYVRAAKNWYWWSPYDATAFVRPAAYPLWITFVHNTRIPFRLAAELLYLGGHLVLIAALRRCGLPRLFALVAFALAVFHPISAKYNDYVQSDAFYAGILPIVLAGLIFLLARRRVWDAVWTGFFVAVLWNIREESILLLPLFLLFLALFFGRALWENRGLKPALRTTWRPMVTLVGVAAGLVLLVYSVNYRVFHSFAKAELLSRPVAAAYQALMQIRPSQPQRFVPISKEARLMAYEVSPAFAKLRRYLEGKPGAGWEYQARVHHGIHGEISAGWTIWALRDAAGRAGQHKTPAKAAKFYGKVAGEIERAFRQGRLPQRQLVSMAHIPARELRPADAWKAVGRVAALYAHPYQVKAERDDKALSKKDRKLYRKMLREWGAVRLRGPAEQAVQEFFSRNYRWLMAGLTGLAPVMLAAILVHARREDWFRPMTGALLLLLSAVAVRFLFFAYLDATAYPAGFEPRYQFPVISLYIVFVVAGLAEAIRLLRRAK